ncbi:MAG: ribosome assembly cofactor RimP [Bacteroidales bacterium]|jgi:ribosome maturation factor RimP|nr:ribosome assembly cofactor RimP [Bacteroidales bacterium]MDD4703639.1 ribosome assembly cofactor RimP [Bacteroidales bacterium]MDX9797678.1 ribosome assembly cofactor RimP [Bacteroidales bacterium]
MIDKERVHDIVNQELENTDLFLIDIKIGKDNKISVIIDGDNGVTIQNCIDLSRQIEKNFDREVEDFELSVMSAGIGEPLKLIRQYKKNFGKSIEILIKENSEKIVGELIGVDDEKVIVKIQPKKKKEPIIEREILIDNIKESKIIILF